jgi:uncharacterized coiled-coil protein SlyX
MDATPPWPQEVWERTPVEAQASIRALEARVTTLEAAVQRLEATVQHLTERLPQDSRTSSRPPSSDPPQAIGKRLRRVPSGRRPGGQPGHEGQARAWRWTAVTAWATVFVVRLARRGKVAHALLGERFWGWLVTARWRAYRWYPTWRRQRCWAHLWRAIEAMIERGDRPKPLGKPGGSRRTRWSMDGIGCVTAPWPM